MISALLFVALFIFCATISFIPGYGVLALVKDLTPAQRVGCSGCVSAAFCGGSALACFLIRAPVWLAGMIPLAIGLLLLGVSRWKRMIPDLDAPMRQIIGFWLLFASEVVLFEVVLPTFGGAGWFADWWVHFHQSLVYANLVDVHDVARTCVNVRVHCSAPVYNDGVMTVRTPLYNILGGIPLSIFDGQLAAYQVGSAVWSAILIGPVILLAQRRGLKVSALAGWLFLLNPFLMHLAVYPWPKTLAAAFEVLAIYCVLGLRDGMKDGYRWAGVGLAGSLVMALFAHPSALLYISAIGIYLIVWQRPGLQEMRQMIMAGLGSFLILIAWLWWGVAVYGWRTIWLSSMLASGQSTHDWAWLGHKIEGILTALVPTLFLQSIGTGPVQNMQHVWATIDSLLQMWFNSDLGAMGVVNCVIIFLSYRRISLSRLSWRLAGCLVVCVVVGSVFLDPMSNGGSAADALAAVIALAIILIATIKPVQHHKKVVLLAIGVEMLIACTLYLSYLSIGPWDSNPNTVILQMMRQQLLSDVLGGSGIILSGCTVLVIGAAAMLSLVRADTRGKAI